MRQAAYDEQMFFADLEARSKKLDEKLGRRWAGRNKKSPFDRVNSNRNKVNTSYFNDKIDAGSTPEWVEEEKEEF